MSDNNETKVEQEPQAPAAFVVEAGKDEQPTCEMRARMYGESFLYMVDKNGFSALVPVHKIDQVISEPGSNTTSVFANGKKMVYHDAAFIGKIAFALDNRSGMIISAPRTPVIASDHKAVLDYWATKAEEREPCKCETIGELIARMCNAADEGGLKVATEPVVAASEGEKQAQSPRDRDAPDEWGMGEGDLTIEHGSSTSTATECSDESDDEGEEGIDYISMDKMTVELLSQAVLGAKAAFDAVLKVKNPGEKPGETSVEK
jgi:hypothetical protein